MNVLLEKYINFNFELSLVAITHFQQLLSLARTTLKIEAFLLENYTFKKMAIYFFVVLTIELMLVFFSTLQGRRRGWIESHGWNFYQFNIFHRRRVEPFHNLLFQNRSQKFARLFKAKSGVLSDTHPSRM
jgi:hypothetical protein